LAACTASIDNVRIVFTVSWSIDESTGCAAFVSMGISQTPFEDRYANASQQ
jgi:hypothetical protein